MKPFGSPRCFTGFIALLLALSITSRPLAADEASQRAAALADRQESDERARRLASTVEELLASQAVLQKKLNGLVDEIRQLREDQSRQNPNLVTRDELRRLAEQVQEIDRKRETDKRLILEEIQKLAKTPVVIPVPTPAATPNSSRGSSTSTPSSTSGGDREKIENGYYHVVEKGETLSVIVQAYREKGVKVTRKAVEEANPGMNPNRLIVGRKIFIPDPGK